MKSNELSQLTTEELLERYRKFKEELFHVRFQMATGQLEKTHQLQGLRRNLARVLTFLSQKEVKVPVVKTPPPPPAPKVAKAPKVKAAKPTKAKSEAKPKAEAPAQDKKKGASKKATASAK